MDSRRFFCSCIRRYGIYDDEMEFVGIKPGKTTVTCTNTANKEKVTFTITVK